MVKNEPTEEGRMLGKELARLADTADAELRAVFPGREERCGTCAFRDGTIPNGCPSTLMAAIKCVLEREPFYCHERKREDGSEALCVGAFLLFRPEDEAVECPWSFPE